MDALMARTMVETLAKGIDPLSGLALPENHLCIPWRNEITKRAPAARNLSISSLTSPGQQRSGVLGYAPEMMAQYIREYYESFM